jgi:hypothetical protein
MPWWGIALLAWGVLFGLAVFAGTALGRASKRGDATMNESYRRREQAWDDALKDLTPDK